MSWTLRRPDAHGSSRRSCWTRLGALLFGASLLAALSASLRAAQVGVCVNWNTFPAPPLLWKLSGPRGQAGFLLGTMHSDAPAVLAAAARVQHLLTRTQVFVMETRLNSAAVQTLTAAMHLQQGHLETLIGPRLYARAAHALMRRGITPGLLHDLKPWAAMLLLGSPISHGPVLDAVLADDAARRGLRVIGLETTAEQIRVLNHLPLAVQKDLLRQTLDEHRGRDYQQLLQAYLGDNLRTLVAVADRGQNQPGDRLFYRRLLHDRNQRMARRSLAVLQTQRAFIAVGALHLPGLLRRLGAAGYCAAPMLTNRQQTE